jgi:ribonucleoside-diphosphate reductase alpha chain
LQNEYETQQEKMFTLFTSMLLRHNAKIKFIIKTAKKVNDNITSFSSAMCRVLSKYVELEEIKGEVCPECGGGKLIRENGCVQCSSCGWSRCS